ncbi:MAG: hypothetical protein ACYC9R_13210, partial [Nitrosotalea sp.]
VSRALAMSALGGAGAYGLGKLTETESKYGDIAGAGLGALFGMRGKGMKDLALLNNLKGIDPEKIADRAASFEALGIHGKPAEVARSNRLAAMEGQLGKTGEGVDLLQEKAEGRLAEEKDSLERLLGAITKKEGSSPETKELYNRAYSTTVKPEVIERMKESEIMKDAFNRVSKKSVYKDALKGISEGNFAYLDQVKRALGDMISSKKVKYPNEARIIRDQQDKLVSFMDELNPAYKEARAQAQKEIVVKGMRKLLNTGELTGSNMYNKYLKNNNKYEDLQRSLKNAPEAQEQLGHMKKIMGDLINMPSPKGAAALSSSGISDWRNTLSNFIHKLKGKQYDKASIEVIYNPKWKDDLKRISEMHSNTQKAQLFATVLSRAGARGLENIVNGQENP